MLHTRGIRPSLHRMAVLGCVANGHNHPSAGDVYAAVATRMPSLSPTTVYNSLHLLVESGLLRELRLEPGLARFDLAPQEAHNHFRCRRCGRIFDIPASGGISHDCPEGFVVENVEICYAGICPECNHKPSE